MRLVLLILLLVSAQALVPSVAEQTNITQIHEANFFDKDGNLHQGLRGQGQFFITAERPWDAHSELDGCHAISQIEELAQNPGAAVGIPYSGPSSSWDYTLAGTVCGNGEILQGRTLGISPDATLLRAEDSYYQYGGQLDLLAEKATVAGRVVHGNSGNEIEYIREVGADPAKLLVFQAHTSSVYGEAEIINSPDSIQVAVLDRSDNVQSVRPPVSVSRPEIWPEISVPGCAISLHPPLLYPGLADGLEAVDQFNEAIGVVSWDCPRASPSEKLQLQQEFTRQGLSAGTATGVAVGVALLAREVAPNVPVDVLREAMFRTADPFLPTIDENDDGIISANEFHKQHGNIAGWGKLDPHEFIAVAHYLELNENSTLETAMECAEISWIGRQLWLNPNQNCVETPVAEEADSMEQHIPTTEPSEIDAPESKSTPAPLAVPLLILLAARRLSRQFDS